MTDNNDKDRKPEGNRPAGGTLTLKRPSIEQSKVKQSFGAGRSKTVVVETKRKRFGDDKPTAPLEPKAAPRVTPVTPSPPSNTQTPAAPKAQPTQRSGVVLRTLTAEEKEARDRALAGARVREAEDRKRQEEDAKRRAEQDARDLITKMQRGDIDQMSFAFTMEGGVQIWDETGDMALRTIERVGALWDVSVVTFPADPETEAAARSLAAVRKERQRQNFNNAAARLKRKATQEQKFRNI